MSFSDDAVLTAAKELYLSKIDPIKPQFFPRGEQEYLMQFEKVAEEFSSFVLLLRRKLTESDQS